MEDRQNGSCPIDSCASVSSWWRVSNIIRTSPNLCFDWKLSQFLRTPQAFGAPITTSLFIIVSTLARVCINLTHQRLEQALDCCAFGS
eukprot:6271289-Amphidinium_carterae.1